MDKKNQKSARGRIKDIYGNEVADNISFDEYWERQHLIESYSNAESIRAKEYRKKWQSSLTDIHVKICVDCGNEECICHLFDEAKQCTNDTQAKLKDGECCQTKTKKK